MEPTTKPVSDKVGRVTAYIIGKAAVILIAVLLLIPYWLLKIVFDPMKLVGTCGSNALNSFGDSIANILDYFWDGIKSDN